MRRTGTAVILDAFVVVVVVVVVVDVVDVFVCVVATCSRITP